MGTLWGDGDIMGSWGTIEGWGHCRVMGTPQCRPQWGGGTAGLQSALWGGSERGAPPRPPLPGVELIQHIVRDALQHLPGEGAQQLPAQLQRLEDAAVLIGPFGGDVGGLRRGGQVVEPPPLPPRGPRGYPER